MMRSADPRARNARPVVLGPRGHASGNETDSSATTAGGVPARRAEGGRRRHGHCAEGGAHRPLVSVVTVVYNGAGELAATIDSVLALARAEIEYIIIDGASTDGTVDVIKSYDGLLDYWVSEPDGG